MLPKILISRCFLGEKVRYDGQENSLRHTEIQKLQEKGQLVSICPEVAGGLPIPRAPAEIQPASSEVINIDGVEVTEHFDCGANIALSLCKQHDITLALLKESSPSCGSSMIYDGNFSGTKIQGQGKTTELLRNAGIKVYSENEIELLIKEIEDYHTNS